MDNLWNDAEAGRYKGVLGPLVHTSRLLGSDKTLVLYGGGNTSLKARLAAADVLFVKGSGSDLARVEAADFVPLDLAATRAVLEHAGAHGSALTSAIEKCVIGTSAIRPSIETLMHAALPFPYVEHTHADNILAVGNVETGERTLANLYGELAPVVAYHDSGLDLARACLDALQRRGTGRTIGLILRFHGVVAFGGSARESYDNMLLLVNMAEDYLKARNAWEIPTGAPAATAVDDKTLSGLRAEVSRIAGRPLSLHHSRDPLCLRFAQRDDLSTMSQEGPATPQHAFFTKRVPLIGRDVAGFAERYREYLQRHLGPTGPGSIDCAPRIVIDAALGICAFGPDADAAATAAEVYRHDIEIISRASLHGVYRSAPEAAIARAELEYGGPKPTAA